MEGRDGGSGPSPARQAGYVITGSGGADGQYVFANVEEFDAIIVEWKALRDRITGRGETLRRAIGVIEPPATDIMSWFQARAATVSLTKAEEHRREMENYANGYVRKLEATREEYVAKEEHNTSTFHHSDEG